MSQQQYINEDRDKGIFRVHRSVFTSPEVLAIEKANIFDKSWLFVGHESEVPQPNNFITRDIAGRPLIFCRDSKGNARVLINSCTHRGAKVCRERAGKKKIFTCMYHAWSFDNTGKLVGIPGAKESYGPEFDRGNMGLREPRHASYRGFVFVNFAGDEAPDLLDYLGDIRHEIDLVVEQSPEGVEVVPGVHQYSMRANWKLLMENSVDSYHGVSTHQTYFEMVSELAGASYRALTTRASTNVTSNCSDLGGGHSVISVISVDHPLMTDEVRENLGRRRIEAAERLGDPMAQEMLDRSRLRIVFPTFAIIDLSFGLAIRTMYPLAPDHTAIYGFQLMPRGLPEAVKRHRIENALTFWGPAGLATPDDVVALEECQHGYTSVAELGWNDISRGMLVESPPASDERQMRAFWREWNEQVAGVPNVPEGKPFDRAYLASVPASPASASRVEAEA